MEHATQTIDQGAAAKALGRLDTLRAQKDAGAIARSFQT